MIKATVDLADLSAQEVAQLQGLEKEFQDKGNSKDVYLIAVKK